VAATNADLESMVRAGTFRTDLYYRLCVFSVHLPPLRERREDIPLLASWFLKKHVLADTPARQLTPDAMAALAGNDWPGNVRELENAIIRGIHIAQTENIEISDLGINRQAEPSCSPARNSASLHSFKLRKQEVIETFERDYLTRLLYAHQGNVSQAARTAGKERRDLGKMLKKYRLDPRLFHPSNSV
jgi:DNA-binding NtrC family response regulator